MKLRVDVQNTSNLIINIIIYLTSFSRIPSLIFNSCCSSSDSIPSLHQMDITLLITHHLPTTIFPPPPPECITSMYEMKHSLHQKHGPCIRYGCEDFVL